MSALVCVRGCVVVCDRVRCSGGDSISQVAW